MVGWCNETTLVYGVILSTTVNLSLESVNLKRKHCLSFGLGAGKHLEWLVMGGKWPNLERHSICGAGIIRQL